MRRAALLLGAMATACGGAADGAPREVARAGAMRVAAPFAYAPRDSVAGALYLVLTHEGPGADTLDAVRVDGVREVVLHASDAAMAAGAAPAGPLAVIDAATPLALRPGGAHLMLLGLARLPAAGGAWDVTLTFRRAGPLRLTVPVLAYGDPTPLDD
ncbi:MAG: copper chaperone PCu(A)C [Gemmatimonadales bacterium]|nr:copper chaperone PCu(A)C [Gemmatimonadales bacterium]